MKNFFSLVICMFAVMTANAQTSGVIGDSLTWTLNAEGTLTISGTGSVPSDVPWGSPVNSIKKIVIEEGVTGIRNWAFAYYYGLTSVVLPNTLETIGNNAFFYCTGLTYFSLPASVTSIGDAAFSSCKKLTGFAVETGNTSFRSIDGVLFNAYQTSLLCYPIAKPETAYTVPDGVRSIEADAFSECVGLTSIFLPNSLEIIGDGAFGYNPQLTSLVIPNSVTYIGTTAFWICQGLTHITIPASVTYIGYQAFESCTGLRSITVLWTDPALVTIKLTDPFHGITKSDVRLYIPKGTESKYRNAKYGTQYVWNGFDIKEGSENNYPVLSSLTVNKGSLYPSFNQLCTSYRVSVGNSVNSITLSATPYPLTASVEGDGEKTLVPGENIFNVTVTSETGEVQTYTLTIFRLSGEYAITADGYKNETVWETWDGESFQVIYGRDMYYILETFDISGNLSFRFDLGNGIVCDKTIDVQPNSRYKITLDLSTNPTNNGVMSIVTPYDQVGNPGKRYIEYPYHDYLLTVSEGGNQLSAIPITLPGTLTAAMILVSLETGIISAENSPLQVYPNPATDHIRLSGISGKANIRLYGIDGQMLINRAVTGDEVVSISYLPAGMYFIAVKTDGKTVTSKLIKK
jgi:hypothetical protein